MTLNAIISGCLWLFAVICGHKRNQSINFGCNFNPTNDPTYNVVTAMLVRLTTTLSWSGWRDPETEQWVAVCDSLQLTALGDTWQELNENIIDILNSVFGKLMRERQLAQFLRQHGWQQGELVQIPNQGPADDTAFDIPYELTRRAEPVYAGHA